MGGGGDGPDAPDPMVQARADIKRMQAEARLQAQQKAQADAAAAVAEQKARGEWQTDLGTARSAAQQGIMADFRRSGLDPQQYTSDIEAALTERQGGMQYGQPVSFGDDIGENLMGDIRNTKVRGLTNEVNKFAPEGFADKAFGSTADDAILDAILGDQYGEASDAIMRAQARGNLNEQGFDYAMKNLDTQKAAGGSRLQGIGGGVLEGYRGELGGIADRARSGASSWDFGDTYDPSTYKKQLGERTTDLSGRLEGDIRNAVGGEQFFNISDLIAKAGVSQGAQNINGPGGLLGAIAKRKTDEEATRGLGTQGSF